MKKTLLLILMTFNLALFAKVQDSVSFSHTLAFDPINLFNRTWSLSYSYAISDNFELTINPKWQMSSNQSNDGFLIFVQEDPNWLYDSYALHFGCRYVMDYGVYIEPVVYYKYGHFDYRDLFLDQVYDNYGTYFDDVKGIVSRYYHSLGAIVKLGAFAELSSFRINFFCGLGYLHGIKHEKIYNTYVDGNPVRYYDGDYPIISAKKFEKVTLHAGCKIGIRF